MSPLFMAMPNNRQIATASSLVVALLVAFSSSLLAQRWATAVNHTDLTDSEVAMVQALGLGMSGENLSYLRFAHSSELNSEQQHSLQLVPGGPTYLYTPTYMEQEGESTFYLSGILAGYESSFEILPDNHINGFVRVDNSVYKITAVDEGLSIAEEGIIPADGEAEGHNCPAYEYEGSSNSEVNMCSEVVDVLYLRTSEVENAFPFTTSYRGDWDLTVDDFRALVSGETRKANLTLSNSEIGSKVINALIHPEPIDVIVEHPIYYQTTHSRVRRSPVIQQLREQYDADVVVMFFYDLPGVGGIANDGYSVPAQYSSSYISNSFLESATAEFFAHNTAHELGHTFGGHHEWAYEVVDTATGEGLNRPTMMRGEGSTAPWRDVFGTLPYYSNEHVNYQYDSAKWTPTGTSFYNNAIRISNNFCNVAKFEQSGTFRSAIRFDNTGIHVNDCGSTERLCASVLTGNSGGPFAGPYTYEWRYSLFPNASTTQFSTEECVDFTMPFSTITTYYVTLKVTDSQSGQTTTASKVVHFHPCLYMPFADAASETAADEHLVQVDVGSATKFIVTAKTPQTGFLYQVDGRLIQRVEINDVGLLDFGSSTSAGMYYLVLQTSDGTLETHPIWYVR